MYKRWTHEGGIATPLIVSWPAGELAAGAINHAPHQLTDVAPTLYEAAGVAPLAARDGVELPPLEGVSFLDLLRGGEPVPHELFWEHIGNQAVRDGRWKLVREHGGGWQLHDLRTDRSEQVDLAESHPERTATMVARWRRWADRVGVLPREQVLAARASRPPQLA